ncbi:MAG: DNA repair protein RadC [Proteobacteria bacterium]|nr:DNA repair protein RadC [Pseudomonadota bacterium]
MNSDHPDYKGHRQRLKKRFSESGLDSLHDYEVLELLLSYAIPRRDVKPLAKRLLRNFGSLKGLLDAEIGEMGKVDGTGIHTAILIKLVKDLGTLYLMEKAKDKSQITSTNELLDYCRASMGGLKDERFSVIYLNAQNMIINIETIQEGIVNQAVVYPRKVLEKALKHKASAIILVHNHPSGNVKPSDADIKLTKAIQETARVLEILVHDHIIIGEDRFFSFREKGILP